MLSRVRKNKKLQPYNECNDNYLMTAQPEVNSLVLSEYKPVINTAIEKFFNGLPGRFGVDLSDASCAALAKLREYTLRPGKRIRGALGAAAYDFISQTKFAAPGVALAVSLELVQSYLLIIDDVMDKSALRRGLPTIHMLYAQEGDQYTTLHEANMLAINVGLIGQHIANLALCESGEEASHLVSAINRMHQNIVITGFGQIEDLGQRVERTFSQEDIIRKYCLKSSYYTFINPLQAGVALAGVTDAKARQEIRAFGEPAGIAFQLHDDFLGIFGRASTIGKANGDDIREGKYTILVQYALEHAGKDASKELMNILGRSRLSESSILRAQQILRECGAGDYAQRETARYARQAKAYLKAVSIWSDAFKNLLSDLVDYSVSRQE